MSDFNEKQLRRLKHDLMDNGMTEREAYYRARAFLKKVSN